MAIRRRFHPMLDVLEVRATPGAGFRASGATNAVREIPNVVYTATPTPQHLDLYIPAGPAPAGGWPVILALPGGGWRWANRHDMATTPQVMARYGYAVAVADYAYAGTSIGTHAWPADFEDVRQAVRWLRANSGRFGLDPNAVVAWGESAGGNLAALLGTYPDGAVSSDGLPSNAVGAPEGVSARVQAVVDFYGPSDLTALYAESPGTRPYLNTFLGGTPDQVPGRYQDASPVLTVTPDDPPVLIFQGTADPTVPPDQSTEFASALQAAGVPHQLVPVDDVPHGFGLFLDHGAVNLVPTILSFLGAELNRTPSA